MGYLILLVGGRGGWWRGRTVAGRGREGIEGEEREGREKMNKLKKLTMVKSPLAGLTERKDSI